MAVAEVPKALARLRDLSTNLWWCWHDKAKALFMAINPQLWSECRNPIRVLEEADPERLNYLIYNEEYMRLYDEVLAEFDAYMAEPLRVLSEHVTPEHPVAYFPRNTASMSPCPFIPGALGVLSGDHLKSASDMAVPLFGIGLLYKKRLLQAGNRCRRPPGSPVSHEQLRAAAGQTGLRRQRGTRLCAAGAARADSLRPGLEKCRWDAWLSISWTRIPAATPRKTARSRTAFYEANREIRLLQEMLLGIGGMRLIRTLNLAPHVYHMNEGHSAFMVIERLQECMIMGMSYAEATVRVRSNTVFTTHTPVAAGNEAFSLDLMGRYFGGVASKLGLSWQQFAQLGQMEGGNSQSFEMTVLALRLSSKANGVSRLHGEVSRHMWNKLWKSLPLAETPIDYVTNGVHTPSYVGMHMHEILNQYLGRTGSRPGRIPRSGTRWTRFRTTPTGRPA